jgi:hypothetical protein
LWLSVAPLDGDRRVGMARRFSSSLRCQDVFDPIISSSRLSRPHQPYCRSPSGTARHLTPCSVAAHIQDALQAKTLPSRFTAVPCNAERAIPLSPPSRNCRNLPSPSTPLRRHQLSRRKSIPHAQCHLSVSKMGRRKIEIKAIKDDRNRSV